jgi:hypothetical protein
MSDPPSGKPLTHAVATIYLIASNLVDISGGNSILEITFTITTQVNGHGLSYLLSVFYGFIIGLLSTKRLCIFRSGWLREQLERYPGVSAIPFCLLLDVALDAISSSLLPLRVHTPGFCLLGLL